MKYARIELTRGFGESGVVDVWNAIKDVPSFLFGAPSRSVSKSVHIVRGVGECEGDRTSAYSRCSECGREHIRPDYQVWTEKWDAISGEWVAIDPHTSVLAGVLPSRY